MKVGEEKIIETAYKHFRLRGVRATSMQKIAKESGISPWNVNLLFKSKKELVLAVVLQIMNRRTAHLLINASLAPSAVNELSTFFKFVDETIAALGDDLLKQLQGYNPLGLDHLKDVVEGKLIPCLEQNVIRGLTEGYYREGLDAGFFASSYFYFLRTLLEMGTDWSQTIKAISQINQIFLHGILNRKGMQVFSTNFR